MLLPASLATTSTANEPKDRSPSALSNMPIRPEHFRLVCRYGGQRRIDG